MRIAYSFQGRTVAREKSILRPQKMTDMTDFVIISLSAVFCALLVAVTSLMLRRAFPDGVLTEEEPRHSSGCWNILVIGENGDSPDE